MRALLLTLLCRLVAGTPDLFSYFNNVPIHKLPTYKQIQTIQNNVALMGDSTMYHISNAYFALKRHRCTTISTRCTLTQWLSGEEFIPEQWRKPTWNLEGPRDYGYHHPGCSDCSGCTAKQCGRSVYFPIEFARDVELQTKEHKTSQAVVGAYIRTHPFELCVVSTGIHDMRLKELTDEQYVENVWYYVQQLEGCTKVIWVLTNSVRENTKYPQVNKRIKRWNRMIQEDSRIAGRVFHFIDAYTLSTKFHHTDNVHMEGAYSSKIADIIRTYE